MIIDTHSHIFDEAFDADRQQVIQRSIDADVCYQIMPNVDTSTINALENTAHQYNCCFPLMRLHPTSVNNDFEQQLNTIEQKLASHKFYGIGEIGIDLYWDKTFVNQQIEAFRHQLQLAKKLQLPVSIHVRNAFNEAFNVIDSEIDSTLSGVFHCFAGTLQQYQHIEAYKTFMIGIGGIVTYKNGGINKIITQINTSKILLETDSPYLSPEPNRGKRNEPFNITYTAKTTAALLNISVAELSTITTQNAIKLFKLPITQQKQN